MFDSLFEVDESFLHTFILVILSMYFHFANILIYYILLGANRLNPDQLILAVKTVFQSISNMFSSLLISIGTIKDRYFIFFCVYKVNKILKAIVSYCLSNFISFLVVIIKKIIVQFHIMVYFYGYLPIIYFLR